MNCAGVEGGAIRVLGWALDVRIKNSKFSGNSAEESGGSVYARADDGSSASLSFENVSFHGSTSRQAGGACYLSSINTTIRNCDFQECSSVYGGALMLRRGLNPKQSVEIIGSIIENNSAEANGGGIHVSTKMTVLLESTIISKNSAPQQSGGGIAADDATISLVNAKILGNEAQKGGGIAVLNKSKISVHTTYFSENIADGGGGLFMQDVKDATIQKTELRNNKADGKGGGILLKNAVCEGDGVRFVGNKATDGGGLAIDQSSRVLCSRCRLKNNKASGNGGGLHAKAGGDSNKISAQLDRCTFSGNRAVFGGGIYYRKLTSSEDRDTSSQEQNAKIEGIVLINASFSGNAAEKKGPAVHSNRKSLVSVLCPKSATDISPNFILKPEEIEWLREISHDEETCRKEAIRGNNESAAFTTYVRKIELVGDELTYLNSNVYQLSEIVSGSVLPTITVTPLDDYGQSPALSLKDDLSPKLKGNTLVGGVFSASLNEDGSYSFSGIRTNVTRPGQYNLTITFLEVDNLKEITISVIARECHVGETQKSHGVYCELCGPDAYTVFPSETGCLSCPLNANCTGNFTFAQVGYWLPSPCHNRTVECLNSEACNGENASETPAAAQTHSDKLYQFTEELETICPVSPDDISAFQNLQCGEVHLNPELNSEKCKLV